MTRDDMYGSDVEWISDWVMKVEALTGLDCTCVRQVWNKEFFTIKELKDAQREDAMTFKGLANDLMRLC